jgi:chitin disaccharide deacetylase
MKTRMILTGMICLTAAAWAVAQEPTYAERLGWPEGSKVLIIHSDDAGMSYASNRGAMDTLEAGTVTSISIMMPCPWVPEIAAYLKENPHVDAGLHLTLTSEWDPYRWAPVAGKPAVPGLCDPHGYLWDSVREVVESATPDEVEREIRAQIERAEDIGIDVTHIDTHMGTLYGSREYLERYIKVGIEKQLPILVVGGHRYFARREFGELEEYKAMVEHVWDAGLPVLDDLHGASYDWKTTDKKQHYIDFLRELQPGLTQMIVHPTKPGDEIGVITGDRTHLYGDYYALVDPDVKQVIEEEGIILTTWRELKQRRDALNEPEE